MNAGLSLIGSNLIVVYLAAVLVVGLRHLSTKDRSAEDFLVGEKGPNQWLSGLHWYRVTFSDLKSSSCCLPPHSRSGLQ
jgi:Na+/proline symporter